MASMPADTVLTRTEATMPVDLERMRQHADAAAELLRSVGNAKRLLILCELVSGETGVGALHKRLALSQSALSQHLAVLREAGLVQVRREGGVLWLTIAREERRNAMNAAVIDGLTQQLQQSGHDRSLRLADITGGA